MCVVVINRGNRINRSNDLAGRPSDIGTFSVKALQVCGNTVNTGNRIQVMTYKGLAKARFKRCATAVPN